MRFWEVLALGLVLLGSQSNNATMEASAYHCEVKVSVVTGRAVWVTCGIWVSR